MNNTVQNAIDPRLETDFPAYAKELLTLPGVTVMNMLRGSVDFKILDQPYRMTRNAYSGFGKVIFKNTFDICCTEYRKGRFSTRGIVANQDAPAKVAAYVKRRVAELTKIAAMQADSENNRMKFVADYNAKLLALKGTLSLVGSIPNPLEITGSPDKTQTLGYVTRSGHAVSLSVYDNKGGFNARVTKGFRHTDFTYTNSLAMTPNEFFTMIEMASQTLS